jgi:hypothetical protein
MRDGHRTTRRAWLRATGGVVVGLPLLESLRARPARGQPAERPPRRLIVLFSSNGTQLRDWRPSTTGTGFALPVILGPLDTPELRSQVSIISGLKMQSALDNAGGNAHASGMTSLLTGRRFIERQETEFGAVGYGAGISIDQAVAQRIAAPGQRQAMRFGVGSQRNYQNFYCFTSYGEGGGAQNRLAAQDFPLLAYEDLFSAVPDAAVTRAQLERELRKRRSVLDLVLRDFDAVRGRVGSADRARLDAHAQRIRELEQTLVVPDFCIKPAAPTVERRQIYDDARIPDITRSQIDLLTSMFTCDIARVATLQLGSAQDGMVYSSFVDDAQWGGGLDTYHHGLSHSASAVDQSPTALAARANRQISSIARWVAGQLADLANKLRSVTEPDGSTLLDNTLIVWVTEVAEGPSHAFYDMPFLTLGSAGGAWRTGLHVDYDNARNHNDLLVSIAQAMGLADVTTFGDPAYVREPLGEFLTGA